MNSIELNNARESVAKIFTLIKQTNNQDNKHKLIEFVESIQWSFETLKSVNFSIDAIQDKESTCFQHLRHERLFIVSYMQCNLRIAELSFEKYKQLSLELLEMIQQQNDKSKVAIYTESTFETFENENGYLNACNSVQRNVNLMKNNLDLLKELQPILVQ